MRRVFTVSSFIVVAGLNPGSVSNEMSLRKSSKGYKPHIHFHNRGAVIVPSQLDGKIRTRMQELEILHSNKNLKQLLDDPSMSNAVKFLAFYKFHVDGHSIGALASVQDSYAVVGEKARDINGVPLVETAEVEEKFEKYFGYLARCEEKFRTTTLIFSKIKPKSTKMHEKRRQNLKIDL